METTTQETKKMRSDSHAPKNFDPADYEVIDYLDNKKPEYHWSFAASEAATEMYKKAVDAWKKQIETYFPGFKTGGDDHSSISQCNHCGHPAIRWVAVVKHIPTGKFLAFGDICANRCELDGRDAFKVKFLKTYAEKQKAMFDKMIARAEYETQNADLVAWLDSLSSDYDAKTHPFLLDMKSALSKYGSLTENQTRAAMKFFENEKKFQEKKAAAKAEDPPAGPLTEGRYDMTGTIVSTKLKQGFNGEPQLKMLVKLADGNKVWGTVPSALDNGDDLRDMMIHFTATVTRSNDDENFGFFKRPTGAAII